MYSFLEQFRPSHCCSIRSSKPYKHPPLHECNVGIYGAVYVSADSGHYGYPGLSEYLLPHLNPARKVFLLIVRKKKAICDQPIFPHNRKGEHVVTRGALRGRAGSTSSVGVHAFTRLWQPAASVIRFPSPMGRSLLSESVLP